MKSLGDQKRTGVTNYHSMFFRYEVDEISPEASMYEEDFTYVILSKPIPQKGASKTEPAKPVTSPLKLSNGASTEGLIA